MEYMDNVIKINRKLYKYNENIFYFKLPKIFFIFYKKHFLFFNFFKGTPVFYAGTEGIIFLCMHGAGHSSLSFALLAKETKKWGTLVAFDYRGHGFSKVKENEDDLSLNTLINDSLDVLEYILNKCPD